MSKYKNIQMFFKNNTSDIKASKHLTKQLKEFRLNWSTKSDEYIDFLGSNLLGVHRIIFSTLDDDMLMVDILNITNRNELQKDIYNVPGVKKNFKIASNIIYQTLVYIGHLYEIDKTLTREEKDDGIKEVCLLIQYRMFSSLYYNNFKFSVPESIATTVYNKLSHKFLIKQVNSWQEAFMHRVENCLNAKNPMHKRFIRFNTVDSIRILSGIQTKLRGQIKYIYRVLVTVTEESSAVIQESSTFTGGENNETQMKSLTNGAGKYINNIKSIALQTNDFIDMETVDIIASLFNNIEKDTIYKFLKCISNPDKVKDTDKLLKTIEDIILISFEYLQRSDINIEKREYIPKALILIRYYFSSSKVKNETMLDIKEYLAMEAKICTGKKTNWVLITLALIYINYIFLRSLKD